MDYLRNGLIVPPVKFNEVTESYREDMDPVGSFVDGCVFRGSEQLSKFVTARQNVDVWSAYCHANSLRVFHCKRTSPASLPARESRRNASQGRYAISAWSCMPCPRTPNKIYAYGAAVTRVLG